MYYNVQFNIGRNPMIINPPPKPWRTLRQFTTKSEAASYAAEMRQGARDAGLTYLYRVKTIAT